MRICLSFLHVSFIKYLRSALYIVALILFAACGKTNPPLGEKNKPLVLVSIAPYQMFVQKIGGEHLEVRSIVRPGADIHTYEPTPRQRESLKGTEIWFRIGEPFETKLVDLFQNQWLIVDLREGVDLIADNAHACCCQKTDNEDRHMWLSPKIAQLQARKIAKILCGRFPMHRAAFEANLQTLIHDLDSLDKEIELALAPLKNQLFLVSHPAFGYFCRDYSLKQLSVEFEGKDPGTKYLSCLFEEAKFKHPRVAISLPQHNNKGTRIIAQKLHLPIKTIDPYSHDYFETMRCLKQWIASQE
jgi:zinc transport system substrate-binding protein